VNAGFDRYFSAWRKGTTDTDKLDDRYLTTDDHCFTIQQREMVFRLNPVFNDVISRPDTFNGVNDMALKVFSSANRFPNADAFKARLGGSVLASYSKDAILRNAVAFVGVAQQPVDFMNTNQKDNLAVQVAGTCTIWNTGSRPIRPGQKIVWTFPVDPEQSSGRKRKHINGEPITKLLFAVQPLEAEFSDGKATAAHDYASALFAIHDPWADKPTPEGASLKKTLDKIGGGGPASKAHHVELTKKALILYEELRSRVIGTALSGCQPGGCVGAHVLSHPPLTLIRRQFDILLSSGH
jgi:hypothetical protein